MKQDFSGIDEMLQKGRKLYAFRNSVANKYLPYIVITYVGNESEIIQGKYNSTSLTKALLLTSENAGKGDSISFGMSSLNSSDNNELNSIDDWLKKPEIYFEAETYAGKEKTGVQISIRRGYPTIKDNEFNSNGDGTICQETAKTFEAAYNQLCQRIGSC